MSVSASRSFPEIMAIDANHCLAIWGSIFICIWRNETTLEGARLSRDGIKSLAARRPSGIALLNIVESSAPMPPSDVRAFLARILTEFGKELKCSAVVHEGSGFRAAAVRGVVTGLTMLARQPFPHKVFATVEEAGAWLTDSTHRNFGWSVGAGELIDAVNDLRIRIQRS